jgi:hypothetical protein
VTTVLTLHEQHPMLPITLQSILVIRRVSPKGWIPPSAVGLRFEKPSARVRLLQLQDAIARVSRRRARQPMLHFLYSSQSFGNPLILILYMTVAVDFILAMQVANIHPPMLRYIRILLDLVRRFFLQPPSVMCYSCLKTRESVV